MSVFRAAASSAVVCFNPRDFITLERFGGDGEEDPTPIDPNDIVVHLDATGPRVFCFDAAALLQYAMTVLETDVGNQVLHPLTREVISPSFIGWLTLFVQSKDSAWQRYIHNVLSSVFEQKGQMVMSIITFMQQVYHIVLAGCSACVVHAVNNYVGLLDALETDLVSDDKVSDVGHAMLFTYGLPIAAIVAIYSQSDGTTLAKKLEASSKKLCRPEIIAKVDLKPMYKWIERYDIQLP